MTSASKPMATGPMAGAAGSAALGGSPKPVIGLYQAIAIIVGIVIGAGIFALPSLVARFAGSEQWMFYAWILGGVISLAGALCYAELATAYPHAGGDYHFLWRAYGRRVAFLFAWARFSVVTTGSIALLAYVFGQYMTQLAPLGPWSEAIYALASVIVLTYVNVRGMKTGARTQTVLTILEILGLLLVIVAGLFLVTQGMGSGAAAAPAAAPAAAGAPSVAMFGLAMVFVLFTFGGWNEAAYISAELKDESRNMVRALVGSIVLITVLYLLVNWAYLHGLGLQGMIESRAVAADLMKVAFGRTGETLISLMVAVAALTSINATMIVGARTNFAVGRDWPVLKVLGKWDDERGTPLNALLAQAALAIALVLLAAVARGGVQTMVDYTAPVFWTFFFLSTLSLIILRRREPNTPRPFHVPLYPVLPLVFCAVCLYMLWSSLAYVQTGALVGVGVLAVGAVLMMFIGRQAGPSVADGPGA